MGRLAGLVRSSCGDRRYWFVLHGKRRRARDAFRLHLMSSLEFLTVQDIGSPQVFQTGETFNGVPLIDYQHPHDLIMGLGAAWERRWPSTSIVAAKAETTMQGVVPGWRRRSDLTLVVASDGPKAA